MLRKLLHYFAFFSVALFYQVIIPSKLAAQAAHDSLPARVTLEDCINFAMVHQPALQQSLIDEDITKQDIRIALSGWLPQASADANAQHYLKLPVSLFPNLNNPGGPKQEITTGSRNTSAIQLSASQTIYRTDLLYAGKTARDMRKLSAQNTQAAKINLNVNVSRAFYDVLLSQQQLQVLDEDIVRLEKNYKDAFSQYQSGITEKTDYQRTIIALNNARAERKNTEETVKIKYAYLKQVMGAPLDKPLTITFDSAAVQKEIILDTLQNLAFENRIEYQSLQTSLNLQHARAGYYRWSFLPSLSAFGNYNIIYQNDQFSQLYNRDFPNSLVGLKLSLPIFEGGSRWHELRKANLQYNRLNFALTDLKSQLTTEYTQAIAAYKSNQEALRSAKENIDIAKNIFNTVKFQYDKGVVSYLEVIVSETDLRTAQLNYLNALFRVLSSTLDVKKALGNITLK